MSEVERLVEEGRSRILLQVGILKDGLLLRFFGVRLGEALGERIPGTKYAMIIHGTNCYCTYFVSINKF